MFSFISWLSPVVPVCCFFTLYLHACSGLSYEPYQVGDLIAQGEYQVSLSDVVFLIRSQQHPVHFKRAEMVREDIEQQCRIQNLGQPQVVLLSAQFPSSGQWTILPILTQLRKLHKEKKWIFLCEEESRVSVQGLLKVLSRYNWNEELFLGKPLSDEDATIIHHFRFYDDPSKFLFPDFEAGWLFSRQLLTSLVERWETASLTMDFSIDVKHEIAFYLWDSGKGITLTPVAELCSGNIYRNQNSRSDEEVKNALKTVVDSTEISDCVTSHPVEFEQCGKPVVLDDMFFAVKTCEKFHKDRVSVVQKTWGKYAKNIVFYSDKEDESIPTVSTGVPNTEKGHCGKLYAIFDSFHSDEKLKRFPWLLVTDDDTILSVSRLQKFLSCYDPTEIILLGERYGFGHMKNGYDYLTGGGGMIFSRAGISELLATGCRCRKNDDPDDMIIGSCARHHQLIITHTPLMHQARPTDYAKGFLQHQTPLSFHKHWNSDPVKVYNDWFAEEDRHLRVWGKNRDKATEKKDEL